MSAPVVPFIPKARYIRIECDLTDDSGELRYPGFWCEVRQNMTNGERDELVRDIREIDEQITALADETMDAAETLDATLAEARRKPDDAPADWKADSKRIRALQAEQRAMLDAYTQRATELDRQKRDLIAPHIKAWNLYEADSDEEPTPVPPPCEGGAAVLEAIEPDLCQWMIVTCMTAYRLGKALGSSMTSGAPQEPGNAPSSAGPQVPKASRSRTSRKR